MTKTFIEAANLTFAETVARLGGGEAVVVETVLSTDKYKDLIGSVVSSGAFFGLIYIGLSSPELACKRVRKRQGQGGHGVPVEKIQARWQRSIDSLGWYAQRAHVFLAFDNSSPISKDDRPIPFATGFSGRITVLDSSAIPQIAARFHAL